MTQRHTRNKLKHQADMMIKDLVKGQGHLKFMDDLSEGQSDYLNTQIPILTTIYDGMIKTVQLFREGL